MKIVLADDHAVVRHGVSMLVKEIYPFAELLHAQDFDSMIAQVLQSGPDLVVCDVNMPGSDSFRIIQSIKEVDSQVKILLFSAYPEHIYAMRFLNEGANGYLHKDADSLQIKHAIHAVIDTGRYVSKSLLDQLLKSETFKTAEKSNPVTALSNREIEVAKLIMQGMGLLEIANALQLHVSTVSTYKGRIYEKLGISNIPELINVFSAHYR